MKIVRLAMAAVASLGLTTTMAAAQDAENGQSVFRQCRACHQVGANAKNLVGPTLTGIVGRKAGTVEGFNYSEANKKAGAGGLVWTEEQLLKYLENPLKFMPGTKMAYAGLKDEADRKDLIAYLKSAK
jgi:cytochrome c